MEMDVEFRTAGKQPERWTPLTGEIRRLPAFTQTERTTVVPMKMEKDECVFVVFRKPGKPASDRLEANYPQPVAVQELGGEWRVAFESAFKTPRPITLSTLTDLSEHPNDSVRFFSGTATYTTTATLKPAAKGERLQLRFGEVGTMAKVYVNGQYAGGVWTTPYTLDVTDLVRDGQNEIKVEVVNTWVNRIVGDLNLPESEREVYCFVNPHRADSPLPPSGLIGKAVVETVRYAN